MTCPHEENKGSGDRFRLPRYGTGFFKIQWERIMIHIPVRREGREPHSSVPVEAYSEEYI